MAYYVIKPDRDADFYLRWSTHVDDLVYGGDRAEMLAYLEHMRDLNWEHDIVINPGAELARADHFGTSARDMFGGWDASGLVVHGTGWLSRERWADYVRAYNETRRADAAAMLEPFDDDVLAIRTCEDSDGELCGTGRCPGCNLTTTPPS